MPYQKSLDRNQMMFYSLDSMVSTDCFARIIDSFINSLDLKVIPEVYKDVISKIEITEKKSMSSGEFALFSLAYNFKRSQNLFGFNKLMALIG